MDEIRRFIIDKLVEIGINKEQLSTSEVTIDELGLSSLELVDLSLQIIEQYKVNLKLKKNTEVRLQDICNLIEEELQRGEKI